MPILTSVANKLTKPLPKVLSPKGHAIADYITIGECCNVLRGVFGEYEPSQVT